MEEFPIHDLVRQFPDRAMRWALELPKCVEGLLELAELPFANDLDYGAMRPLKLSTIHDDLREEIPDVLYEIPLRLNPSRSIVACILAEHSSTRIPDLRVQLMIRMANVWREQDLEWDRNKTPASERERKLVISGVLYTGDEPWKVPPQIGEQLGLPSEVEEFTPRFQIFFVDLNQLTLEALDAANQPFAWLLKLFRDSQAPRERFLVTLTEVLERLSELPPELERAKKRLAWIADLLAWRSRPREERSEISAIIQTIIPRFISSNEVKAMSQTIAEYYVEQGLQQGLQRGRQEAKREMLIRLLERQFGLLPQKIKDKVLAIHDESTLEDLCLKVLDARSLDSLEL